MRAVRLGSAALVAVSLVACGRATFVVQQYPGPARPAESVAILRVNGNEDVRVVELDDRDVAAPLDRDARLHIEMLPARHSVVVAPMGFEQDRRATSPRLTFQAEPGKVYRVAMLEDANDAHVYEVDRATDAVVRDATEITPPKPPPVPAPPVTVPAPSETPPPADDAPAPESAPPPAEPPPAP